MPPPDKNPTIRQIAAKLGYSNGAVSMALRDHPNIPKATRDKIQKQAKAMGYKVDAHFSQLMAYMRSRQKVSTNCNLAWLYCGDEPRSYHRAPWSVGLLAGAAARSEKLGFASVMLDESSAPPYVNRVAVDYFAAMRTAVDQALKLGYKRPGYCRTDFFDMVSIGRYSGAFLYSQDQLPMADRVPLLPIPPVGVHNFAEWFQTHRPDVLITSEKQTLDRVRALGLQVPTDVGVIHLSLNSEVGGWTGIDQQHELIGSAAIDMLSAHLNRNERGIPANKKEMLIEGKWQEGCTTRRQT